MQLDIGVDVRQTGGCETPDTARAKKTKTKTSLAWPLNPEENLKDYYQSHTHTQKQNRTHNTLSEINLHLRFATGRVDTRGLPF